MVMQVNGSVKSADRTFLDRWILPVLKRESNCGLIELLDYPEVPQLQRMAIHEELSRRHRELSNWMAKNKLPGTTDRRLYLLTLEAPPHRVPAPERVRRLSEVAETICWLRCVGVEEVLRCEERSVPA
jgi:hypothetical protein